MIVSVADVKVDAKEFRIAEDDGHVVGSVRFVSCGSDNPFADYRPVGFCYDLSMMPDAAPGAASDVLAVVRDEAERLGCRCLVDNRFFDDCDDDFDDVPF